VYGICQGLYDAQPSPLIFKEKKLKSRFKIYNLIYKIYSARSEFPSLKIIRN